MNLLSYRGPGKAGGVSGALARIIEGRADESIRWFYLDEGELKTTTGGTCSPIFQLPENIVAAHYRYCNNFLWPVLHDMPERALLDSGDRLCYQQFNKLFALNTRRLLDPSSPGCFVQDYQLALTPITLSHSLYTRTNATTSIFWHIPWPKSVERAHRDALIEVAIGLLSSQKLGFHIEEYASNFLNFVRMYLPQYEVDFDSRQVMAIEQKFLKPNKFRPTQIVVSPLGLDVHFWREIAKLDKPIALDEKIQAACANPYILSVDRADYTKGILQRIAAINHFFELCPELIGNISFVQICQPSRIGLSQFDKYWQQIQKAAHQVNLCWRHDKWQPLIWIQEPVKPRDLAWLYANATSMLVSPLRDGLNLTAKEFITCSRKEDSLLLLSSGAGAWQEFGDLTTTIDARIPVVAAHQIIKSLKISRTEKIRRMQQLKQRVEAYPLSHWWNTLTDQNVKLHSSDDGKELSAVEKNDLFEADCYKANSATRTRSNSYC